LLSQSSDHEDNVFDQKAFMNNGLYNLDEDGSYPAGNQGIYELSFESVDKGRFKPPSLRNVAITAPYMHDGSIATLEEVVRHYERGGRMVPEGTEINGQDVSGDGADPDVAVFLGWEWSQVGRTPAEHWGHNDVLGFLRWRFLATSGEVESCASRGRCVTGTDSKA